MVEVAVQQHARRRGLQEPVDQATGGLDEVGVDGTAAAVVCDARGPPRQSLETRKFAGDSPGGATASRAATWRATRRVVVRLVRGCPAPRRVASARGDAATGRASRLAGLRRRGRSAARADASYTRPHRRAAQLRTTSPKSGSAVLRPTETPM